MNPLDFILMKEEYIKKNPPPPKKEFVKVLSFIPYRYLVYIYTE